MSAVEKIFELLDKKGLVTDGSILKALHASQEQRQHDEIARRRQHPPLAANDADGDAFHYFLVPPPAGGYLQMVRGDFLYMCCDVACKPHGVLLDQMDSCVLPDGPETPEYRRKKALYGLGWRWVEGWYCTRHRG